MINQSYGVSKTSATRNLSKVKEMLLPLPTVLGDIS
jgi:hypothetical protein